MKVFRLPDESYVVVMNNKSLSFKSYKEVSLFMYDNNVDWDEIELGLTELQSKNHQVAEYGIGLLGSKKFIFTERLVS